MRRYGTDAALVLASARRVSGLEPAELLAPVADGVPVTLAELLFGITHEGAVDIDDLLDRRTRIGLVPADRELAVPAAEQALALAAASAPVRPESSSHRSQFRLGEALRFLPLTHAHIRGDRGRGPPGRGPARGPARRAFARARAGQVTAALADLEQVRQGPWQSFPELDRVAAPDHLHRLPARPRRPGRGPGAWPRRCRRTSAHPGSPAVPPTTRSASSRPPPATTTGEPRTSPRSALSSATATPDLLPWRAEAALSAVRQGRRAEGVDLARAQLALARKRRAPFGTAIGLRTLASVDPLGDGQGLLRQARALAGRPAGGPARRPGRHRPGRPADPLRRRMQRPRGGARPAAPCRGVRRAASSSGRCSPGSGGCSSGWASRADRSSPRRGYAHRRRAPGRRAWPRPA